MEPSSQPGIATNTFYANSGQGKMDRDLYLSWLEDQQKTKHDLMQMRENALQKNKIEYVLLCESVLDVRFPSWRNITTRKSGKDPTTASFKNETRHFESQKEAYIWLIEKFIQFYPEPFKHISAQTYAICTRTNILYFAKTPRALFNGNETKISDKNLYHKFSNGWYGTLNLSNEQKKAILYSYASCASLSPGIDWNWKDQVQTIEESLSDIFGHYN